MCVSLGANTLDGKVGPGGADAHFDNCVDPTDSPAGDTCTRYGEDGVATGVALCFDEWANGDAEHGIQMFYNGEMIFEGRATCGNREGCPPVSLFDDGHSDANWHGVELSVTPDGQGGAKIVFDLDQGLYGGYGLVSKSWPDREGVPQRGYVLPDDTTFLGFSGRTGGATNNHFVKGISIAVTRFTNADVAAFQLSGSAVLDDPNCLGCLSLTQAVNAQSGAAYLPILKLSSADSFTVLFQLYLYND